LTVDTAVSAAVAELASSVSAGRSDLAIPARAKLATALQSAAPQQTDLLDLPPVAPTAIPSRPGVYIISSGDGQFHYVGLALDLHWRFHNPDYGHLSANNHTRSAPLVADGRQVIRLIRVWSLDPTIASHDAGVRGALARLEIESYVGLILSSAHVVNSASMLGRVGESTGTPVILCAHATGNYLYCDSLSMAVQQAASTAIPAVVHGYQRTAVGYAARWATELEVDLLAPESITNGVVAGEPVLRAVNAERRSVDWSGVGRNAGFRWLSGPLSSEDLDHLTRYGRARYERDIPRSRFNGVSWESRSGGWQCRAKTGFGPKDLWQTRRRDWLTDLDAAVFREERILAQGWQRFNVGRYASNAEEINRAVGDHRYRAW
jgi:hypothetical protein